VLAVIYLLCQKTAIICRRYVGSILLIYTTTYCYFEMFEQWLFGTALELSVISGQLFVQKELSLYA